MVPILRTCGRNLTILRSTTLKDYDSVKENTEQAYTYALDPGTFDQKAFFEAFSIFDNRTGC